MKPKSKKNIEVEIYVDSFKTEKGYAPTYEQVAEHFNISRTAAWCRCIKFRHKMNIMPSKQRTFTKKDLVTFGNYLLSEARKKNTRPINRNGVTHADIENYLTQSNN